MLHFAWVLDGIPGNSDTQRNSKDTTNAREKGQHAIIFHQQGGICMAVSVRFPLAAFQLPASCADAYSCSSNEFVIFNERKLHEISMKLQVAIFVTIPKPEIRGGGASS